MQRPRFTKDQITRLIKEVERRPCLWNRGHEHYNDAFHSGMAWKTIAGVMKLSENTVKLKWKDLRGHFNRIVNRNQHSYTGGWPYSDKMLFLLSQRPNEEIKDELLEVDDYVVLNVTEDVTEDVLPHSDEYYDLLFLESLAPYFKRLEPVRRVAMRAKIQEMLMTDIITQNNEKLSQGDS